MKNIFIIPITLFILLIPVLSIQAASVNLLNWTQRELDIENQASCYFSLIRKFKDKYYSFQGQSIDLEGNGRPFTAMVSDDGVKWRNGSQQFGEKNEISINVGEVMKNKNDKEHFYVASVNEVTGPNVYRSEDGVIWKKIISNGFGTQFYAVNGFVKFKGKLYLFTRHKTDGGNIYSRVYTSKTGKKGSWQRLDIDDKIMGFTGLAPMAKLKHKEADGSKKTYLYVINGATDLFRTADGITWEEIKYFSEPTYGEDFNADEWNKGYPIEMINFNGYTYMTTFGSDGADWRIQYTWLWRSKDPAKNNWELLDIGLGYGSTYHEEGEVVGQVLLHRLSRRKSSQAKYLYFSHYPTGYMFRIGKDTNNVERVSEKRLGFEYGPKYVDGILVEKDKFFVYGSSLWMYEKQ